jgi:hypothetical protein
MASESAPCPTCEGERYDTTYEGCPAEDGGPGPCVTCNGSGTTTPRPMAAESKVIDLMAALEKSVKDARAANREARERRA